MAERDPNVPLARVKTIFGAAVDLPAGERGAFVAAECVGDHELHSAVVSLLESHDRAADFLDRPSARCRHHRWRAAVFRDGTGRRFTRHPIL